MEQLPIVGLGVVNHPTPIQDTVFRQINHYTRTELAIRRLTKMFKYEFGKKVKVQLGQKRFLELLEQPRLGELELRCKGKQ
jgi:hypothetical protein